MSDNPIPYYVDEDGRKRDAANHRPILKAARWQGSAAQKRSAQLLAQFTGMTDADALAMVTRPEDTNQLRKDASSPGA